MKPQFLKVNNNTIQSFNVRHDIVPQNHNIWHYHEEIELIHFEKGAGTQFVGNSVQSFQSGDIVLVGSNLPHYWLFDKKYLDPSNQHPADIRVAHFKENFLGSQFFEVIENTKLKDLLTQSKRGILINDDIKKPIKELIDKILTAVGSRRILILLEILTLIAETNSYQLLSSENYEIEHQDHDASRMNIILDHITQHYNTQISLPEISSLIGMTPNSFCRYFKSKSGKTLFQFVIELRIGLACKLLKERKMNVKQICFESGFQNFVSFHKYFKESTGYSPLNYQKHIF